MSRRPTQIKQLERYAKSCTIIGSIVILQGKDHLARIGDSKPERYGQYQAIGIITERDVISYLGTDNALTLRTQISEIMSTPLITINTTNSLRE